MLVTASELYNYTVHTTDGEEGSISDLYVEEAFWRIRYLVVTVSHWLSKDHFLLDPSVIDRIDVRQRQIRLALTGQQLQDSPPPERHQPISREYEEALAAHYGWVRYWLPDPLLPVGIAPTLPPQTTVESKPISADVAADNPLRSCQELAGYEAELAQGHIMPVRNLALALDAWQLRFLILQHDQAVTPVSFDFVNDCSWAERRIRLSLHKEQIARQDPYLPEPIIGV